MVPETLKGKPEPEHRIPYKPVDMNASLPAQTAIHRAIDDLAAHAKEPRQPLGKGVHQDHPVFDKE